MAAPLRVDTETFTDQYDFVEFAHKLLGGTSGVGSLPTDNGTLDWIERALPLMRGTPYEEKFTRAIAACLTDRDPVVRREALRFFETFPAAAGAERIVELARGDRSLFAGVPDPESKEVDLDWSLLRDVGARINIGDDEAKEIARREALRDGGDPTPLIAALTASDPVWTASHALEIVRRHPKAGFIILFQLERVGGDVAATGEEIAATAASGDRRFRDDVKRLIKDAGAKARILAATKRRRST